MRKVFGTVISFAVALIAVAVLWHLYGETTVTASIDGRRLHAMVLVDGKERCTTPCKLRLGPGTHTIKVPAPDGVATDHSEWTYHMFTLGRGLDLTAKFSSPEEPAAATEE
jgi:hypothetical protein